MGADHINDIASQVKNGCWLAFYKYLKGDLAAGLELLEKIELNLVPHVDEYTQSAFYFQKGRLLLYADRFQESETYFRSSIRISYKYKRLGLLRASLQYPFLGWLYLREKKYEKAHSVFERGLELAQLVGWTQGVATCTLSIAVVLQLQKKEVPKSLIGKARRAHTLIEMKSSDARYEQLRFLYFILTEKYEKAESVLSERKQSVRMYCLDYAYLVVDSLFLEKLSNLPLITSGDDLKKAQEILIKNQNISALELIKYLSVVQKIDMSEFIKLYTFF